MISFLFFYSVEVDLCLGFELSLCLRSVFRFVFQGSGRWASAGFLFRGSFLPGGSSGAGFFVGETVSLALSITCAEMSRTSVAVVSEVTKVSLPFLGGI